MHSLLGRPAWRLLRRRSPCLPTAPRLHRRPVTLTHLDASGQASMVDVSDKAVMHRRATARAVVRLGGESIYRALVDNQLAKGNALEVARLAAIQGAKQTAQLIPLCHAALPLTVIRAQLQPVEALWAVEISVEVAAVARTGVEMEALTGASIAALTVYDMCKSAAKTTAAATAADAEPMRIEHVQLVSKIKQALSSDSHPTPHFAADRGSG